MQKNVFEQIIVFMRKTFLAIIAMFICLTAVWSDSFYAIGGAGTLGLAGDLRNSEGVTPSICLNILEK